eukprot:1678727-Amphidinium_carterae.1
MLRWRTTTRMFMHTLVPAPSIQGYRDVGESYKEVYGPEVPVFPLTAGKVRCVMAVFKAAGYRSSPLYLSAARVRARSLGFTEDEVGDEIARARRAVMRGQGGPVQRTPLPVDSYDKLWDAPLPDGGVLDVRYVNVVATWWLLREIEAAALR